MVYIAFILDFLSEGFWFYLPVLIANVSVYTVYSFLGLGIPFDLNESWIEKRIIGEGRNIAGVFLFLFIAILIGIIQKRPLVGLYLGAGGIVGCNLNSFLKRRLNKPRGSYVIILDQTDFILGASLFYISYFDLSGMVFLSGLVIAFILHHLVNLMRKGWERLIGNSDIR